MADDDRAGARLRENLIDVPFGDGVHAAVPERTVFARRQAALRIGACAIEIASELALNRRVHVVAGARGGLEAQTPVHEEHAVDPHDGVERAQPLPVVAVAPERGPHLDQTGRRVGHRARIRILQHVLAAHLLGPGRHERLVFARDHVAHVAEDAHRFVIADERVDRAAGPRRFVLQLAEKVDRLARVWTAIHHVAGLHQMRAAAGPVQLVIDQPCRLQDFDEPIVGAVDVADGDDAVHAVDRASRRRRRRARPRGERDATSTPPLPRVRFLRQFLKSIEPDQCIS
jgi:hypothetical protein